MSRIQMPHELQLELFRVLSNMPRFVEWLDQVDHENLARLKTAEGALLLRAQGRASLIDEVRNLLTRK